MNKPIMKTKEEIEQLAEQYVSGVVSLDEQEKRQTEIAYMTGYTQCQEDMADEKYTEEDLLHAFREGVLLPNSQIGIMEDIFKQVVNSLKKQK